MKELKNYYKAIEDLTKLFCKKYFKDFYNYRTSDWTGGDIGGVIYINDYWFNLKDIKTAIKYKATKKELFDYYDHLIYHKSFENYLKFSRGFSFEKIKKQLKNE